MKRNVIWIMLSLLISLLLVLTSCTPETSYTPTTAESTTTPVDTVTTSGNWWDELGEPQYGGKITTCQDMLDLNFNNLDPAGPWRIWHESLIWHDWALDRDIFGFNTMWSPSEYFTGFLAESWEWTDSQTLIFYLREGVHWQDKEPVNGREFTAEDVEYHFDRILGTGSGFTEPDGFAGPRAAAIQKVTALDKYTVEMKFHNPTPVVNFWCALEPPINQLEAREWIEQGDIQNWRNVVATGPWILTDYVSGSSMTLSKNPNYWGYDERHPENQLPYIDELKVLAIPDSATQTAALRTGELDFKVTTFGWQQAEVLAESNPDLMHSSMPYLVGSAIGFRADIAPFTDIRVRKALQLATDRQKIAETYFGGTADWKPFGVTSPDYGMAIPYDEWPQELQEEYGYDPERARELLAEAGYPEGFETNIICNSNDDLEYLQIIKSEFMEIGVDMEIKTLDSAAAMDYLFSGKHDQMFVSMGGNPYLPPYMVLALWTTYGLENVTFHNDTNYDALFEPFENAVDTDGVQQAAKELDRYYTEQHWFIPAYCGSLYYFWQPYVKGFSGEYLFWTQGPFWARFWVDQDLKQSMGY